MGKNHIVEDQSTPEELSGIKSPQEPEKKVRKGWKKFILSDNKKFSLPRKIFLGSLAAFFLLGIIFILIAATDIPPLNEISNPESDLSTQIVSGDGQILGNFYSSENRVSVQLNEISPHIINALVATEDKRFYDHSGIDPISLPALLWRNIVRRKRSGGSTISMQLTRNLYERVGRSRTAFRKVKEAIVATIVERKFTKKEILIAYLNTVNIYGSTFGIETASKKLFGKEAKDLTIEESALIVGMLKGQGSYNPFTKAEKTKNRRNLVIELMVQNGFLERAVADSVKQIDLVLANRSYDHVSGVAPYFREHVRKYMKQWCKDNEYDLYTDGLRIYTTIDSRMQIYAEQAVQEHLTELQGTFNKHLKGREPYKRNTEILDDLLKRTLRYQQGKKAGKTELEIRKEFDQPKKMRIFTWAGEIDTVMTPLDSVKHYAQFLETGFVSIDPSNGHIKAWVGGISAKHFQYDHVAQGKRQVGSTFKPFVYAAAMDNTMRPCDIELNQPVHFYDGPKKWSPKNADGSKDGKMTLKLGLAKSMNLITARLMKKLGPDLVAEYASRIGIETELDRVPALCLGTQDLSALELTGAYCTFVNHGRWNRPIFITRIEDKNGNVLEEFVPESREALSDTTAYKMIELLRGVVDEPGGTAGSLRYRYGFDNQIGGKTGTTQNHSDGWFMGATPNLVSGVWVGCADRRMRFRSLRYGQGAKMALPIWALYMKKVYADSEIDLPKAKFKKPRGFNLNLNCEKPVEEDPVFPGEEEEGGDPTLQSD